MPNSSHSRSFRRLFDTTVSNIAPPLQERLNEVARSGEEPQDASNQLALDIVLVATSLHVRKGGLTKQQYAFLGDMCDHANRQDYLATSIEEHAQRFADKAKEDELYHEPPTDSLNLLRGYDALQQTQFARMYKDFLMKIVSMTLTTCEKGTPEDEIVSAEFDSFWTEVATATRSPKTRVHRESSTLIDDLNKAVLEFVGPTREVVKAVDQLSQMEGLKDTEGFIRRTFTNYCAQAILVDSVVDSRELELFHDLAPTLMFFGKRGSIENLKELFRNAAKNIAPTEMPLLVSILDIYDHSRRTDLGKRARALYFKLANTAFKSDTTVNDEEMVWLNQYTQTLFPGGITQQAPKRSLYESRKTETSTRPIMSLKHQAESKMTFEQSLEELNSLIGLHQVKHDFAQLVNFIKVQKMRAEKGLPGSSLPKTLSFYGNPGTGKSTVAKILANIYRDLGLLKKGQVHEVNRADLGGPSQVPGKLREAVSSTRGGVLLINDAWMIVQDTPHAEAYVESLVSAMRDHKDAVVVVLAGNAERMEQFIDSYSSLKERFNRFLVFEDYTPAQMYEMYEQLCSRAAFHTSPSAQKMVQSIFDQLYARRNEYFGNAREVRRVFDGIIGTQANRVISLPDVNEEDLSTITDEDVEPLLKALEKPDDKPRVQGLV